MSKEDLVTIRVWRPNITSGVLGHATLQTYCGGLNNQGVHINYLPHSNTLQYFYGYLQLQKVSGKYDPFEEDSRKFCENNPPDLVLTLPLGKEVVEKINDAYILTPLSKLTWSAIPVLKQACHTFASFFKEQPQQEYASSTTLVASILAGALSEEDRKNISLPTDIAEKRDDFFNKFLLLSVEVAKIALQIYMANLIVVQLKDSPVYALLAERFITHVANNETDSGEVKKAYVDYFKRVRSLINEIKSDGSINENSNTTAPADGTYAKTIREFYQEFERLEKAIDKLDLEKMDNLSEETREQEKAKKEELLKKLEKAQKLTKKMEEVCSKYIDQLNPGVIMDCINSFGSLLKSCCGVTPDDVALLACQLFKLHKEEISEELESLQISPNKIDKQSQEMIDQKFQPSSSRCTIM